MKIIKMPVSGLNPENLKRAAQTLLLELAANATDFPAAPVANLTENSGALEKQLGELSSLEAQVASHRLQIATTCDRVRADMNRLGDWLEDVTTDPGKLAKVATLRAARTPAPPMPHVTNLKITLTDSPGVVVLMWDSLYKLGVKSYEVQTLLTGEPLTGTWGHQASVIKAKCRLTGLTSGTRLWVRVRAIGTSGAGNWSTPANSIVP